ncbi:hypothetical protein F5Y14DRAFT_451184 [Nemania sp. NC0429]|nr:hypothetical protein F5Y14DRAFT_451184 [Nemania sp. NC0429]
MSDFLIVLVLNVYALKEAGTSQPYFGASSMCSVWPSLSKYQVSSMPRSTKVDAVNVNESASSNCGGAFRAVVKIETDADHSCGREVIRRRGFHMAMAAEATQYLHRGNGSDIHAELEGGVGVGRGSG